MTWQWFHRLGSPKWFYEKTRWWTIIFGILAVSLLVIGAVWGLAFSPADLKQGNSYRIIYIHVPCSIVAMGGYYVMAIAGAVGLIWRMKLSFMAMKCAAPIGAMLTFLGLFTGAVWGKPTWGDWWVWDARITSMLILLFLYLGIMALQEAYQNKDAADKVCAVLAIVGMVNIPIIYKSVDWWFTLHQPATIKFTEKSTIDPSMLWPLLIMIIGTYLFFGWNMFLRLRLEILQRERKTKWVQSLVMEGK